MISYVFESIIFSYVIFFQAEDGIRYGRVTGVQTCALPICSRLVTATRERPTASAACCCVSLNSSIRRSEERRVGKECRARWIRYLFESIIFTYVINILFQLQYKF